MTRRLTRRMTRREVPRGAVARGAFARGRRAVGALALGLLAAACGVGRRLRMAPAPPDPVETAWRATLDSARAAIVAGRYAAADGALTTFHDRYPDTPAGADALYWRAVARSDAPEPAGGARIAISDLDAYRATGATAHLPEAVALRRALVRLDSARATVAVPVATERPAAPVRTGLVSRDSLRARDEELERVRTEAAATQAELDRLRRRLAAPGRRP